MKKIVVLLIIGNLFSACTSRTIFKKPDDLIPKEQMVNLLTDIFIANSAIVSPDKTGKHNKDYLQLVYKKYHIDTARFKRSNYYYTTNIKEYRAIYQEVVNNIDVLEKKYKKRQKTRDSIFKLKRDSVNLKVKKKTKKPLKKYGKKKGKN